MLRYACVKWHLVNSSWIYSIFSVCNDVNNSSKILFSHGVCLLQIAILASVFKLEEFFKCLEILNYSLLYVWGTESDWDSLTAGFTEGRSVLVINYVLKLPV